MNPRLLRGWSIGRTIPRVNADPSPVAPEASGPGRTRCRCSALSPDGDPHRVVRCCLFRRRLVSPRVSTRRHTSHTGGWRPLVYASRRRVQSHCPDQRTQLFLSARNIRADAAHFSAPSRVAFTPGQVDRIPFRDTRLTIVSGTRSGYRLQASGLRPLNLRRTRSRHRRTCATTCLGAAPRGRRRAAASDRRRDGHRATAPAHACAAHGRWCRSAGACCAGLIPHS